MKTEKLEQTIEEVREYLENIIALMPGHVFWKDIHCHFLGCNDAQAKMAGLNSRHEIVGKSAYDIISKNQSEEARREQAEAIDSVDREIIRSGISQTLEEPLKLEDGTERVFLSSKIPLKDKNGKIVGLLGIAVDITAQKQMEKELRIAKEAAEAANHAKTEFIANMGHDIRTPLTGIIGFSRFLEEEIKDAEEKEYAHQIHQSGEQLLGLLNGVLDLITADSTMENQVLHKSFDLRRVVQDVVELEKPAVKAQHLEINSSIADGVPPYVVGDRMKLHRILLNLTGNAIKFTKKGYIELSAKLLELKNNIAMVEFAVKDTGIGIPAELQDKVFDRFFKASPSYVGLYTGNGIGLHIAQKYVELLHGEIRLTSQVDVGTTFSFVLPLPIGEKPNEEETAVQPPIGKQITDSPIPVLNSTNEQTELNLNQPQVLLVEDNNIAMNVLKMMVKPFPVQIYTAMDAESALELVQKQQIDLIISDLGLPKMQGDTLASKIRQLEKVQNRKPATIVGLTGHALGEITEACLKAGMNAVYRKPMEPAALKTLIEASLKTT